MNERLSKILGNPWTIPTAVGVLSFGSGIGVGYILARRRKGELHVLPKSVADELSSISADLDRMREEREKSEIEESKRNHPTAKVVIHEGAEEFLAEKLEEAMTSSHDEEIEEVVVHVAEPVNDDDDDWDYDEEVKYRTPNAPYVIHRDEFWAEEMSYTQTTLCYYAGDNIMADEDDSPVYNYETVTGPLKFGHGSGDPNVVHVRNDKRRAEYEILRHEGLFSVEVLGLEIEDNARVQDLHHSKQRKFRME